MANSPPMLCPSSSIKTSYHHCGHELPCLINNDLALPTAVNPFTLEWHSHLVCCLPKKYVKTVVSPVRYRYKNSMRYTDHYQGWSLLLLLLRGVRALCPISSTSPPSPWKQWAWTHTALSLTHTPSSPLPTLCIYANNNASSLKHWSGTGKLEAARVNDRDSVSRCTTIENTFILGEGDTLYPQRKWIYEIYLCNRLLNVLVRIWTILDGLCVHFWIGTNRSISEQYRCVPPSESRSKSSLIEKRGCWQLA